MIGSQNSFAVPIREVTPAELAEMIAAAPSREPKPRKHVGSRPRKPEHVERRRRWAAAGKMPPRIACRFTAAEQAVLAAVAAEVQRRGDCRKSNDELADIAGVSISTAKNALREARALGLIVCEERRGRWFNLPNIVKITAAEWRSWLRLRHGVKLAAAIDTRVIKKPSEQPITAHPRSAHRMGQEETVPPRSLASLADGHLSRSPAFHKR